MIKSRFVAVTELGVQRPLICTEYIQDANIHNFVLTSEPTMIYKILFIIIIHEHA